MIINSSAGGVDRLPLAETVTITPADWNAETKLATVSADWAVEGMSATVSPDEDSMQAFSDIAVQGVYLVQILNGYLVFKSGSGAIADSSITINIIAINDSKGVIVNTGIITPSDNGLSTSVQYSLTVSNNEAKLTGFNPTCIMVIPPYDGEGHEITKIEGITNQNLIGELYLVNNVKRVETQTFKQSATALKKVFIGKQMTWIGDANTFLECTALTDIEIERGRTERLDIYTISNYPVFGRCNALQKVVIPNLVKLWGRTFGECTGLKSVRIEDGVTMESTSGFGHPFFGCTAINDCTFLWQTPPSYFGQVLSSYASSSPYSEGKYIYVPYEKLTAYTTATNWVAYAYYMCGIGAFTAGTTLPTQTTDEAWNLTWYATKADLKAGTNPITTAPSEFDNEYGEIYCTKTVVA